MNREHYRKNPIFGTNMTKPVSVLTEDIRNKLVEARNIISDIKHGFGWKDRFDDVEGLINCGLSTLYGIRQEIADVEIRCDDEGFGPSIRFTCRGIGTDVCPGCFVCGGEAGSMANIAAFVESKEDGETAVKWFQDLARLDFRPSQPNWIQVKVGACEKHESALPKLSELTSVHGVLREVMIHAVVAGCNIDEGSAT